ncbi:DUF1003 domain-containing protein [Paracoccus sulfuroxidans]|uniref:Putative membrane protein n=1 Tax=Paracoccus sulfuroxidans TaxID=384678 RepID=A0A562N7L5_9RHOB|nr:DUF1003 domain-containing protein [Paracoccus sulfuroxidans]TWI28080.1 putative membrane protein [Paracoccus sulfuroxidans]
MTDDPSATAPCAICGKSTPVGDLVPLSMNRTMLADLIRKDRPDLRPDGMICRDCMAKYRQLYLTQLLADETGELGALEAGVVEALEQGELLTLQTARESVEPMTFGARLADRVAEIGGSWGFILLFSCVLVGWMGLNTLGFFTKPFDPYPFILLNLLLSCVAAFQAPVIMMSQRRQEAKDRLRAENDYQINLKAELELRQLHEKIDHQLTHQWRRLLEIQAIQTDLLRELRGPDAARADLGATDGRASGK